jgi:hypothetical protein
VTPWIDTGIQNGDSSLPESKELLVGKLKMTFAPDKRDTSAIRIASESTQLAERDKLSS